MTKRCGLGDKVVHIGKDILEYEIPQNYFDHFVSWLSILHIENREKLFNNLYGGLKSGGTFLIEDYAKRSQKEFPLSVLSDLKITIACPFLPSIDQYKSVLENAGFVDVKIEDISSDWSDFVHKRVQIFEQQRIRNVRVHGVDIVNELGYFYAIVDELFRGEYISGIRITGRKK